VADPGAGRVEVHALLPREALDGAILGEIALRTILDVVIEREDGLSRIRDARCPNRPELVQRRGGIVVRQHMARPDGDEITGA
jgi:hypothetical protein